MLRPGFVVEAARGRVGLAASILAAAGVAELADALDLGSSDVNRGGSNPPARTKAQPEFPNHRSLLMQVTETNTDGLKREFRIVVPAGELQEKVTNRLGEIGRSI